MENSIAWLASVGFLAILIAALVSLCRRREPVSPKILAPAWLATLPRSHLMSGRHVGWIRTHWRHWEPIVWGDETIDVWEQLRAFRSLDEDGERVVLPYGERPVNLCSPDASLD